MADNCASVQRMSIRFGTYMTDDDCIMTLVAAVTFTLLLFSISMDSGGWGVVMLEKYQEAQDCAMKFVK